MNGEIKKRKRFSKHATPLLHVLYRERAACNTYLKPSWSDISDALVEAGHGRWCVEVLRHKASRLWGEKTDEKDQVAKRRFTTEEDAYLLKMAPLHGKRTNVLKRWNEVTRFGDKAQARRERAIVYKLHTWKTTTERFNLRFSGSPPRSTGSLRQRLTFLNSQAVY